MGSGTWTRDEHLVALDLYLNYPDVVEDSNDRQVKDVADLIGRSANAVALRLGNYRHLDPESTKGLENVSQDCREIWADYYGNEDELAYEAERARERLQEDTSTDDQGTETESGIETGETTISGTARQGQRDFRAVIQERYDGECIICGLSQSGLLQAGHILPWSEEPELRSDPSNGLLLCYNHHRAFDLGMFTLTADHEVLVRDDMAETDIGHEILSRSPIVFEGSSPSIEYLRRRNERLPWVHMEK
jgi:putative restriction endonuclease